jgi:hypothetical protein
MGANDSKVQNGQKEGVNGIIGAMGTNFRPMNGNTFKMSRAN